MLDNIPDSVKKGDAVIVHGEMIHRGADDMTQLDSWGNPVASPGDTDVEGPAAPAA